MKYPARILSLAIAIGFLTACAAPSTPLPTATEFVPTATLIPTSTPLPPAPTATATPEAGVRFYALDMIDSLNGWAWAFAPGPGVLLHTQDGGRTWTDLKLQDIRPNPTLSFFLDAQTAWVQWYDPPSLSRGLLYTIDAGRHWETFDDGQIAGSGFDFVNPSDGWLEEVDIGAGQAYYWIYATHDSGATWSQSMLTGPPDTLPAGYSGSLHLCNICGDSLYYDPARLVVLYGNFEADPGQPIRLAVSTDLGADWQEASLPLPPGQEADGTARAEAPFFFDDLNGLLPVKIGSQSGIHPYNVLALYATADGGLTWTQLPAVLSDVDASSSVQFVSLLDAFVPCGPSLCATHDGGQTWQALATNLSFDASAPGEHVLQFDFVGPTAGWALSGVDGGETTLWETADGGVTWTQIAPVVSQ